MFKNESSLQTSNFVSECETCLVYVSIYNILFSYKYLHLIIYQMHPKVTSEQGKYRSNHIRKRAIMHIGYIKNTLLNTVHIGCSYACLRIIGQMLIKRKVFCYFLNMAKDSYDLVEIDRSFHQRGTVQEKYLYTYRHIIFTGNKSI